MEKNTVENTEEKTEEKIDNLDYVIYVVDCETTGFDCIKNDVIEVSMYRLSDDTQKTWCMKPFNLDGIEASALRVNGHVLEDLKWETKTGRERYLSPEKVLIEIENWMMEDFSTSENRIIVGNNISFDKGFLEKLWAKCNSIGTFPFGRKMLDVIQIILIIDLALGNKRKAYNLGSLVKDFDVKADKAHTAEGDTKMSKDLFLKLIKIVKKAFSEPNIRKLIIDE